MPTSLPNHESESPAIGTINLESRLHAAQRAFASADFEGTVAEIADIPENLRTPELRRLHNRASQLLETATLRSAARDSIKRGDFEQAISQIEQIPDLQRDQEIQDLLKQAQRALVCRAAVSTAESCLQEYRYAEAVAALETIPPLARNTDVTAMLGSATKKARMVQQILNELNAKWVWIREEPSVEKLNAVRELVLLQLELQPNNRQAQQRLSIIEGSEYFLTCLKSIREEVPGLIDGGQHHEAMRLLESIPEELRSAEIRELFQATTETVSEVGHLRDDLLATVSTVDVTKLLLPLNRLEELHANPVQLLRSGLFETEFQFIVRSAIRQAMNDPAITPVFKQLIDGLDAGEFCDVLREIDPAQLAGNVDNEAIVAERIAEVVDQMDGFPLPEAETHVNTVNRFRQILPRSEERLVAWNVLFQSTTEMRQLVSQNWTHYDSLLEGSASEKLEQTAKELSAAAAAVFPAGVDWATPILEFLGDPARSPALPIRRAAWKIRLYQRRGRWPEGALTRFTRQKVAKTAVGVFTLAALALGGKILYSLIFGLGGIVGSILALFVVSLWLFFCVLFSRAT